MKQDALVTLQKDLEEYLHVLRVLKNLQWNPWGGDAGRMKYDPSQSLAHQMGEGWKVYWKGVVPLWPPTVMLEAEFIHGRAFVNAQVFLNTETEQMQIQPFRFGIGNVCSDHWSAIIWYIEEEVQKIDPDSSILPFLDGEFDVHESDQWMVEKIRQEGECVSPAEKMNTISDLREAQKDFQAVLRELEDLGWSRYADASIHVPEYDPECDVGYRLGEGWKIYGETYTPMPYSIFIEEAEVRHGRAFALTQIFRDFDNDVFWVRPYKFGAGDITSEWWQWVIWQIEERIKEKRKAGFWCPRCGTLAKKLWKETTVTKWEEIIVRDGRYEVKPDSSVLKTLDNSDVASTVIVVEHENGQICKLTEEEFNANL